MALTASAQSSTLSTWDDTIVPALRKRLESESRILAKRMSVASITSAEESPRSNTPSKSSYISREQRTTPVHVPEPWKSSAIPRPSLQHPSHDEQQTIHSRPNGASSPHLLPKRSRTYSQPQVFDPLHPNGNGSALPPDTRPMSPRATDVRPTRIPIAMRNRTTSTSSHAQSMAPRADSRNGLLPSLPLQPPPNPETSPDLWVVQEIDRTPASSIRHQHPNANLMNELPPFATPSLRSKALDPPIEEPRISTDSEERPFEHWYRGDIHRNGGVGELRVAKQMEMLQIANFGHSIRRPMRSQTRDVSGPSDYGRRRKRAESIGTGTRDSLLLDDERARDVDMVLDESPLTDIEADADTDTEAFYDAYIGMDDSVPPGLSASMPKLPLSSSADVRSETPTTLHSPAREDTTPARIPVTRAASEPLRSDTPSGPPRTSAESAMASHPTPGSRSRTTSPVSQSSDQSQTKHRARSPVASSPASTPKKMKTKAKTPPPVSRQKEDPRHSVAVYPTPEGDVVDAIPTWTQPVQKSRNWDDVVLPVVARKKGLDGQYEQADGSPRTKPPEPIKPAPGTFGFDYSKYKRPRGDEIPMDEFGQVREEPQPVVEAEPAKTDPPPEPVPRVSVQEDPVPRPTPLRSESLAPFSQYLQAEVPTISVTRPSSETERKPPEDDDAGGVGCCKCVIM
ncbi:hypothetical protein V8B97DRAFT_2049568 [Scleroderma yunnanense]